MPSTDRRPLRIPLVAFAVVLLVQGALGVALGAEVVRRGYYLPYDANEVGGPAPRPAWQLVALYVAGGSVGWFAAIASAALAARRRARKRVVVATAIGVLAGADCAVAAGVGTAYANGFVDTPEVRLQVVAAAVVTYVVVAVGAVVLATRR